MQFSVWIFDMKPCVVCGRYNQKETLDNSPTFCVFCITISSTPAHLHHSSLSLIKGFSEDNHISSIYQIVSGNKQNTQHVRA